MSAADYLAASPHGASPLHLQETDAPWDARLVPTMLAHSAPAYEEDLLPALVGDIAMGAPRASES
ncbi:DUF2399 domain-containing protein [Streptomyces phaeofaciens]|jgi:hypothetical protein|uniref:DUF2399 domain-containing protein n=1 Tax=Streptomyces phaeofaciens TaxID=68254 RepID=UPI0036A29B0F